MSSLALVAVCPDDCRTCREPKYKRCLLCPRALASQNARPSNHMAYPPLVSFTSGDRLRALALAAEAVRAPLALRVGAACRELLGLLAASTSLLACLAAAAAQDMAGQREQSEGARCTMCMHRPDTARRAKIMLGACGAVYHCGRSVVLGACVACRRFCFRKQPAGCCNTATAATPCCLCAGDPHSSSQSVSRSVRHAGS
jgi:hypothetical protein